MAGELGHQHEVLPGADQIGGEGVAQYMRRETRDGRLFTESIQ
jgi:hypothetical protein